MDWLSDFGWWLLTSEPGFWIGYCLIAASILIGGSYLVWRYGDVKMGPDPVRPSKLLSEATTVIVPALPVAPNYQPNLMPAADAMVAHMDELADAITDVLPVVDPLADVIETELIDYSTPLFYQIRRPKPYELETFTRGWTRERLERIKEGAP